ncbi:hypothetical protein [Hungatella hathewayi]|uniref:hypothetical protein n=1 Tax=Hungatella hathewayi TaxID=154046 RepID=UPI001C038E80|nr:hypothetical protein [Hungatella hathewayi]MBT9795171.1 hypothetical protein [Hungatella hathewayi]
MEAPRILISDITPKSGKRISAFDKHSKYIVRITTPVDLAETLYRYSEDFFEAAHLITEFILDMEYSDIGKLDTYFFSIAFLYRHCIELGLKAIGFQNIEEKIKREEFVKNTRHNLYDILNAVNNLSDVTRPDDEMQWLQKYFSDLSQIDRESDSFRYPFHIVWESDGWGYGKFTVKRIFNEQTHIDLVKFANKCEAAYEIIKKWYLREDDKAVEWVELKPTFIEAGGYYYSQSVVGYSYIREDFYPYTKAYLETANYLKWYMKNKSDSGDNNCKNHLFFPMCYLYRNCTELGLKTIWFEETGEDFQIKCKMMLDKKHSIEGMWKKVKPYVIEGSRETDEPEYIEVIEDYCNQIHKMDSDANKFRYPMSNTMQLYFPHNKRFDFMHVGDFFEELNNILDGIDSQLSYIKEIKAEIENEYQTEMMEDQEYY